MLCHNTILFIKVSLKLLLLNFFSYKIKALYIKLYSTLKQLDKFQIFCTVLGHFRRNLILFREFL